PTTSSTYFSRLDVPGANSWSCALLDPALLAVPIQRPPDPFAQADLRGVADLRPRARDVERPALREKVDAATVDRRLDAERGAERFTEGARHPEGPRRQMPPRHRHARSLRHQRHQLIQRRHFPAGENVGAIGRRRMLAAEPEAFDEIVDVGEMVIDFAAAERHPPSTRDASEQPEETAIRRSVDAGRPRNRDVDAETACGLARQPLAFEFGDLIDVARLERRVLVPRRVIDVALH